MHAIVAHLFAIFTHLGAFGLILLGILDSSFLFMPLGNDLLVTGLTVQHHHRAVLYAGMAALGSTLGCLLLDVVARKGGEEGLKRQLPPQRIEYLKEKVSTRAAAALAVAALAPPPFPFTPVVAAASAFGYPRWKLLTVIGFTRLIRFGIVSYLAVRFGSRILAMAQNHIFEIFMVAFVVLCAAGSAWSIYKWVRRSKTAAPEPT